jgi:hypothetical protein
MSNLYELMLMAFYFTLGFITCKVWMKRKEKTLWYDMRKGIIKDLRYPGYDELITTLSSDGHVRNYCQHKYNNHYEPSFFVDATGQVIENITHWRKE